MKNVVLLQVEVSSKFYDLSWPQMLLVGGFLILLATVPFRDGSLRRAIVTIAVAMMVVGGGRLWYVESQKKREPATQLPVVVADTTAATKTSTHQETGNGKKRGANSNDSLSRPISLPTEYSGRVEDEHGEAVADAELLLNGKNVTTTDDTGDFNFIRPSNFEPNSFAKLECRKKDSRGVLRASTIIDLAHSNNQLLLKMKPPN